MCLQKQVKNKIRTKCSSDNSENNNVIKKHIFIGIS